MRIRFRVDYFFSDDIGQFCDSRSLESYIATKEKWVIAPGNIPRCKVMFLSVEKYDSRRGPFARAETPPTRVSIDKKTLIHVRNRFELRCYNLAFARRSAKYIPLKFRL